MFVDGLVMHCLIAMQFSRTVAPETSKGPALIAFMQKNKWRKIAILSSTERLWFETRLGLKKQLEAGNMEVLNPAAFEPRNFEDAILGEIRRPDFGLCSCSHIMPTFRVLHRLPTELRCSVLVGLGCLWKKA